jgi:hypothetical protein
MNPSYIAVVAGRKRIFPLQAPHEYNLRIMRSLLAVINRFVLVAVWGGFCVFSLIVGISSVFRRETPLAVLCFVSSGVSAAGLLRRWGWAAPLTLVGGVFGVLPGFSPRSSGELIAGLMLGSIVGLTIGGCLDYAVRNTDESRPAR